ncbi:MAG TPA: aldehyde dehydrogenase family protein [Planctomycetota bacterium]|nr:aldehyde dehydrogenase family protein [Planctomycetota bacterium]
MPGSATAVRRVLRVTNPTTGELLAELPCAEEPQVRAAVSAARRALSGWAAAGLAGRAAVLERVAKRWEEPAFVERVARLISSEMGKPLASARGEAGRTADSMRGTLAACSTALAPVTAREKGTVTRLTREPVGVVAAITPWNFPVGMAREVIVPALLAGNTVVFKPSELVPLTGQAFAEPFLAELPADVLSIVQGDEATGKALVAADIAMVGFVGSVEAGRHIMAACAPALKRLVLELGGKDPMLVCADADLPAAADYAVRESMRNSGQVCCAVERIYVEAPAAERFLQLVVEKAAALRVGPPEQDVFMGPLASEEQRRKVLAQVQDARQKGARILLGGHARPGPGCFMEPTVLAGVTDDMELSRRETFGPVAAVRVVQDAEEAVRLANDSIYGLGASVWCGDPARGVDLASRLQAGQVGVNRGLGGAGDPPWCGVKQSGFGFLGSPDGYRQFTRPLSVSWNEPA